ncbi:MAG: J domain-containing protein, partial [Dehalococcoidia bacterium]
GDGGIFEGLFGNMRQEVRRPKSPEYPVEVSLEEAYHGAKRVLTLSGGRRLEVKIPAGVDTGSRVHITPDSGGTGDLYLVVSVKEHKGYQRQGRDLYTEVDASLEDAVLGGDLNVPTLRGRLALTIPPETQNGQRFRLAGQGMPALNNPATKGDLYATVKVKLPTGLSEDEQELFRRLKELQASKSE